MKRIASIFVTLIMVFFIGLSTASAAGFQVEKTSPKDGEKGIPIENVGVKVFFSEEVYNKDNEKDNAKLCKIVDKDGKEVETTTFFNPKDKKVALILVKEVEENGKTKALEESTEYKLVVDKDFKSSDGQVLGKDVEVEFKTLNSKTNMMISMGMMGAMIVAMIYASSRAMKKEAEETKKQNARQEKFNPYKAAKESGKSVDEIIAAENKRKAKEAEKAAKNKYDDEDEYEDFEEEIQEKTYKVKSVSSASAKGSKYVSKKREENRKRAEIEAKIKANKKGKGKGKKKR